MDRREVDGLSRGVKSVTTLLRRSLGLSFAGDPETGRLMRLLGSGLMLGALISSLSQDLTGWITVGIGASFVCWLIWAVLESYRPRSGIVALIASSLIASPVVGLPNAAALTLASVTLLVIAAHPLPSLTTIVVVASADLALMSVGALLWDRSWTMILASLGLMLIMVLLGLNRRQYRARVNQTERLLEQINLARDEQTRAAMLDERARIAREMHDVLAHSLGSLKVQLELAEALLVDKGDVDEAARRLRRSRRLASDGLIEARNAVAALRTRDVPSLTDALSDLTETHRQDYDIKLDFRTEGEPRKISPAATVSLLGTTREALTNAAKHAPGSAISVVLGYEDDVVGLKVRNEGAVAEPDVASEQGVGHGLQGMRERLLLVGGTLRAGREAPVSESGSPGWLVRAEVPE